MDDERAYICIDLKSFFASVECVERGLDPMTTRLVVADPERKSGTICLAVTPAMKALGVRNRCRVFEIPRGLEYITAPPRMRLYLEYSAKIYSIYLDYFSRDDIHVYSVDEVFIDVTGYLKTYKKTPLELARFLVSEVKTRSGIPAAAGVGTNLYLCKIAMDIMAKRSPDFIAALDEKTYREKLWRHEPLTDFWRIGPGTAERLEKLGVRTMEGITRLPEDVLYKVFGVDAELLIDHAWGREPTLLSDIKSYKSKTHSITSGQVLMRDYTNAEGLLIIKEMTEQLCHEMTDIRKLTQNVSIAVGYSNALHVPMSHGSVSFPVPTDASSLIMPAVADLYDRITDHEYPVRRIFVNFNDIKEREEDKQMTLFDLADAEAKEEGKTQGQKKKDDRADPIAETQAKLKRDTALQEAVNSIRNKYGKDAMFRAMDLEEAATTRERNHQVGGHKE